MIVETTILLDKHGNVVSVDKDKIKYYIENFGMSDPDDAKKKNTVKPAKVVKQPTMGETE